MSDSDCPGERGRTGRSGGYGGEERLGLARLGVGLQSADDLTPCPVDVGILRVVVVVAEACVAEEERRLPGFGRRLDLPGEVGALQPG